MKDNELWLIEQSCKGNIDAFEELIKDYKKSAYNIALRLLQNSEDAEDVSQEALIKVYLKVFKILKCNQHLRFGCIG